jgi:hypothetical protein
VRHRDVAEGEPQRREQQHRTELDALGEGADDQRGGDAGEGRLEGDEQVVRQALDRRVADRVGVKPLRKANSVNEPKNGLPALNTAL